MARAITSLHGGSDHAHPNSPALLDHSRNMASVGNRSSCTLSVVSKDRPDKAHTSGPGADGATIPSKHPAVGGLGGLIVSLATCQARRIVSAAVTNGRARS